MTHEFSNNPIKVHLCDIKTGKIINTSIFIGEVPSDVKKELNSIEKSQSIKSSKVLSKFYGSNWVNILGLGQLPKRGGKESKSDNEDDLTASNELENTTDQDSDTISDDLDADLLNQIGDISDVILDTEYIPHEKKLDFLETIKEAKSKIKISKEGSINFIYDINVYPIDTIFELKQKIFISLGIPIYRQHLWIKNKNIYQNICYKVLINNIVQNISIDTLIDYYRLNSEVNLDGKSKTEVNKEKTDSPKSDIQLTETIEGVPINSNYYKNKEYMQIHAYDTFSILSNHSTTDYYVADLNDIIPNLSKLAKDKYQFELFYYGFIAMYFPMITIQVFTDYIKNEKGLGDSYPDLAPTKTSIKNMILKQQDILDNSYEHIDSAINKKISSSIIETTINIENVEHKTEMMLSLRNLFDMLELNEILVYCKANLLHENKQVILKKSYLNEKELKDIIPLNSLIIKIKISPDTNEHMKLLFYKNGNYNVFTQWREENHMDFNKIKKVCIEKINPIIKMINKLGEKIKFYDIPIVELTKDNISFTENGLVFYYEDDITDQKFTVLKSIIEDYKYADILNQKESLGLSYEYFFNKGMYKYDVTRLNKVITIDNFYDYLSNGVVKQKWETLFRRTRLLSILNIASKLKITISGIRNDTEMENFYLILVGMLKVFHDNTAGIKIESRDGKTTKALKNLKMQDPILYDFKKIYKSNVVYSKICQKPYQPLIVSDDEYGRLSKDKKDRAVKYWNFTKEKPAWYLCPNAKFPYIKFIIKQHPKDFCIPCCKKIEMDEHANVKRQEIHNKCLKEHIYGEQKINVTKNSSYIASYGKYIELGRICRLPENTLEPLLFDTYSPEGTIDQECASVDGYYLLGVDQNTKAISNIGYMFCLIHALNMPLDEFLHDVVKRINKIPDKFKVLLNGNAGIYFKNVEHMLSCIKKINEEYTLDVPWNELFMSIAYYYYGVNTVYFNDTSKEMIELILPKGINNVNQIFPDTHKNLIVLKFKEHFYPIYLFNTEIYKRTGIVETRLFVNESGIVTIIKAVIRKTYESSQDIKPHIDLVAIIEFCKYNQIPITKYYISYLNLCYAVVIQYKKQEIYIPIHASYYSLAKDTKLIFEVYNGEYNANIKVLDEIIDMFNKWNGYYSRKLGYENIKVYPDIEIKYWLVYRENIIGFISNNINYYIDDIKLGKNELEGKSTDATGKSIMYKGIPCQVMLYHPFKINKLIQMAKSGKDNSNKITSIKKELEEKTQKALYDHYLYHLVILHMISILNSQRNAVLRRKIISMVMKSNLQPEKIKPILDLMTDEEDIIKFKNILSRYATQHNNIKKFIEEFGNVYFEFDKVYIENLKNMSHEKVHKSITSLIKSFVKISEIKSKNFIFPNIFALCKESNSFCEKNKLVVNKKKLENIIDVLVQDIMNPEKRRWIFNSIFIEKSVNFFKFIRRKYETITVEISG
jgi:hypothetical protein